MKVSQKKETKIINRQESGRGGGVLWIGCLGENVAPRRLVLHLLAIHYSIPLNILGAGRLCV